MFPRLHISSNKAISLFDHVCTYVHIPPTCSTSNLQVCFGWPNSVILTSFNLFGGAYEECKPRRTWTWPLRNGPYVRSPSEYSITTIHICYRMYFGNTSMYLVIWGVSAILVFMNSVWIWLQRTRGVQHVWVLFDHFLWMNEIKGVECTDCCCH